MNTLFVPTRGVRSINSQKNRTWVFSNPEVFEKKLLHQIMRNSGTFYWIIGLTKIENKVNWAETNEPMDRKFNTGQIRKSVEDHQALITDRSQIA